MLKTDIKLIRKLRKEISSLKEMQADLRQRAQYTAPTWSTSGVHHSNQCTDRMADFAGKICELDMNIIEKTLQETELYLSLTETISGHDLTPDTRMALLDYICGKSYAEIAKSMHAKADSVRSRISRATRSIDSGH